MAIKKRRRKVNSFRAKPGVQYYYDEELDKWLPVHSLESSKVESSDVEPSDVQPANVLTLLWPLSAGFLITQDFEGHARTKAEKGYKYYNGGLDLAYPNVLEGEPVLATAAGILKSASYSGSGYGNVVYIDHLNGYQTIYAHLQGFGKLIPGEAVSSLDVIGYLGHTGNCFGGPGNPDGTHLHFELRYLGVPVDPAPFLQQTFERSTLERSSWMKTCLV